MEKTSATTPPPTPDAGERFFAWMRSLGIQREQGWIGGVAAGIAVRIGIDPVIVRGILVVTALLGAPALLAYAAAWLLLPDTDDSIHLERAIKGQFDSSLAAIGVTAVLGLLPLAPGLWFGLGEWPQALGRIIWTLVLIGLAVWFVVWISQRGSAPLAGRAAPPAPPSTAPASEFAEWRAQQAAWREENVAFKKSAAEARAAEWRLKNESAHERHRAEIAARQAEYRASSPHPLWSLLAIGLAFVAGGATALITGGGTIEVPQMLTGLSVAVAVLGLAVLINGVRGKRGGGPSALAGILIVPLVLVLVLPQVSSVHFTGDTVVAPVDLPGGRPDFYFVGTGDLTVDLRDFYSGDAGTQSDDIYLFVGDGDVSILLPEDEIVDVRSTIASGNTYITDSEGVRHSYPDYVPDRSGEHDRRVLVRVFVGDGDVTLIEEKN